MKDYELKIAGIVRESIVDGPGIRFVVFSQGCPHHCPGCHNEETHDFNGGIAFKIEKIITEVDKNPLLTGVTFSGGEPFCQVEGFLALGKELKKRKLDLVIFTGYTFEELLTMGGENQNVIELLRITDLLIDGRFVQEKKDLTLQFRGSNNQRMINVQETIAKEQIILRPQEY
ncbi:MAG: anaerobic ribonucleoside-triphosphate reductase activating protein [Anaerovoracaceae bacterium]